MDPIIIQELKNLNQARSLLHYCYLEHLSWQIEQDNPSGIQIKNDFNQKIITDDYDQLSIWFSVLVENHCIACARLCQADDQERLELERYPNAKKALRDLFARKKELHLIELNREAVLPRYADDDKPYLLLLQLIYQYCLEKKHGILTTTNFPEWASIYKKIGLPELIHADFKYHDSDPEPVKVYLVQYNQLPIFLDTINQMLIESELMV